MTRKRRKNRKKRQKRVRRTGPRQRSQRAGRRSWLNARNVALGMAALLLVVVGAIFLGSGRDDGSTSTPEASLDKSKGANGAPVVVVEYGDFQ